MAYTELAESIANNFKQRLTDGEVLALYEPDEVPDDEAFTTLYEYVMRGTMTNKELAELCRQIAIQLDEVGAIDDMSKFYLHGVSARIFVGTHAVSPDEEIRIILTMTKQRP